LGIDQSRIALAGESAGAYIAAGAMEMLMNDPEDKQIPMIKNLILIMPMINDHLLKANYTELNSYEKPKLDEVKYYYNQLANNLKQ
jgi:acetyl esterase/lipase